MSFAWPALFLLLPLPFLARVLPARPDTGGLHVPNSLYDTLKATPQGRDRIAALLKALAWICLVTALAGPTLHRPSPLLPTSGRDIVLALDLSGSMEQRDFALDGAPLSRLEAVKRTAAAFVRSRQGDRIGLVIFGDTAYFAQPLTFDVEAVAQEIEAAEIGISGRSTAIADGLGLAMKRLWDETETTRVIILLSDGADTSGSVGTVDAARLAATHGMRLHTIALGPQDLETNPGARDAVDSRTLREMAEAGGGESFRVRGLADLAQVTEALDRLEPTPKDRPPLLVPVSLWHWPASLALLSLLCAALWRPS